MSNENQDKELEMRNNFRMKHIANHLEGAFIHRTIKENIQLIDIYNDYTQQIDEINKQIDLQDGIDFDNTDIIQQKNILEFERTVLLQTAIKYNDDSMKEVLSNIDKENGKGNK